MVSNVPVAFPSPLTGNETIRAFGLDATGRACGEDFYLTTAQIAALAAFDETNLVTTPITTAGNGTLTAAGLIGGQILRTGPTAAFSDATATALQIIAALPGLVVGSTFLVRIKNATAFSETLTAGVGVTLPPNVVIPQFSVGHYFVTVNSATAVTFTHMDTVTILDEFIQILTAEDDIVSTTTLANVTGFAVPVMAAGNYVLRASLPVNGGVGGLKIALGTSDTFTVSSLSFNARLYTASAVAVANETALATAAGSTAAVILAELDGAFTVASAGTLTIQAAQNSSISASTALLVNGFLRVKRAS